MQKLDDATDVVALLTARSINRPRILYEAGVAKGKIAANDRVLGIALGVTHDEAATGPFAQFQNSPDEEDSITSLVLQLIRRHPQAAPREESVRRQVQDFRTAVAALLKDRAIKDTPNALQKPEDTSAAKFFEEIKACYGTYRKGWLERSAAIHGCAICENAATFTQGCSKNSFTTLCFRMWATPAYRFS